jgi:hypothetical protein
MNRYFAEALDSSSKRWAVVNTWKIDNNPVKHRQICTCEGEQNARDIMDAMNEKFASK